jgi:arabinofuranosyltransferase
VAARRVILAVGLLVVLTTMLRSAWVCDDAYITFRVVDNFWDGHGLRWNVGERVWVYSNPLMMLSMLVLHPLSGEFFYTSILFSLAISMLAVTIVLTRLASGVGAIAVAAGLIAVSKTLMDYSTSGLENCWTFLLLAVAYELAFRRDTSRDGVLLALSLVAGLIALNRLDSFLLVLPFLAHAWWRGRTLRRSLLVVLGFVPLLLWEAFALLYYGSLIPNTAYAKLSTDLPLSFYLAAGLRYLQNNLFCDPIALPTIFGAIGVALWSRKGRHVAAAIGLLLYVLYVLRVGGGFMSGRFLAAALFGAVMLWCVIPPETLGRGHRTLAIVAGLGIVVSGVAHPLSPLKSTAAYDDTIAPGLQRHATNHGIADERAHYYPTTGLLRAGDHPSMPAHPDRERGRRAAEEARRRGRTVVWKQITVGMAGWQAGPDVHVLDLYGITDPLLSLVPARRDVEQRIGHMERAIADSYVDSLPSRERTVRDPDMDALNELIRRIHSGPLWSGRRFADIWNLRTGGYDHLIDRELFRNPSRGGL